MLNYRLHQCMDLIVEGVDTGDVRLILQESAAFQSAFNELKTSIDDFIKLIGEVGLEGLKEPYSNLSKMVGEAEQSLQDMPTEWDWKGQIDTLKKPTGDSPPETMVSKIALDHDTNVNACKDGVIEIAKYLEQYKDLFNVGSAGLGLNEKFKSVLKVPQFALAQLVDEDFMFKLVGVDKGTDQKQNEDSVKEAWKDFWDPEGKGEEKKWTDFTNLMEKLAGGVPDLFKSCGQAIEKGKPSDDFQSEVPEKGLIKSLLGGLFGSSSPTKIDPVKVMGAKEDDPNGLLGMPFENLSALVVGLLEMSGAASDAASGAVEAIGDNQDELAQDIPGTDVRDKLIKGYGEKPADEQDLKGMPKTARAMGAFREILDKREFSMGDIQKIDDLPQKLTQLKDNKYESEDEIKELLEILELTPEADEEETVEKDSPLDVLANFDNLEDGDKEAWLDQAEEDNMIDGEGEAKEDNTQEEVDKIVSVIVDDLSDEQEQELEDSLLPEEEEEKVEETFRRWGEIAGIIKG